ncbi:hypothetical protein ZTR_09991 [Talaromyces verruculosus]|nr:hypothetical protein ZTR_09991 [Talaromyces verruculosus]
MGWLSLLRASQPIKGISNEWRTTTLDRDVSDKPNAEHFEYSCNEREQGVPEAAKSLRPQHRPYYPFAEESVANENLPLIKPDEVASMEQRRSKGCDDGRTWIVIDQVVYDCTDYMPEHPGGKAILENFSGQCCSWQFWRFHNRLHMDTYGRKLRIGRTYGVRNRFIEPPRYIGLQKMEDAW